MKLRNFTLKFLLTFLETLYQLLVLFGARRLEGNIQLLIFGIKILQLLFFLVLKFLYQFRLIFTFLVQLSDELFPIIMLNLCLLFKIDISSIQSLVFGRPFEGNILLQGHVILNTNVELLDLFFKVNDGFVFAGNFAF